jgi:hypothetical protein
VSSERPDVAEVETGEVDPLGPDVQWANLAPMIVFLLAVGGLLTLATWQNWGWAYVLGLVLTAAWIGGFLLVKDRRERWFLW